MSAPTLEPDRCSADDPLPKGRRYEALVTGGLWGVPRLVRDAHRCVKSFTSLVTVMMNAASANPSSRPKHPATYSEPLRKLPISLRRGGGEAWSETRSIQRIMGLTRLHGFDPGRIGVFAGPHNGQAAAIQFTRGMARLGYCKLWCGEWCARGALAPGAIYSAMDGMH
jgi:hypothetical protein